VLHGSATPGQGNRPSAATKALNHTVRTFQCAGDLDNASIGVWGMQKKAAGRKGRPRVYEVDKRRMWATGWETSISEAYGEFTWCTYMGGRFWSCYAVRRSLGRVSEL